MNALQEITDRAPTRRTKRALFLLITVGLPLVAALGWLNPATLDLEPKALVWFQISVGLFLSLLCSLFVNFHLTIRLVAISKWVEKHEWVKSAQP